MYTISQFAKLCNTSTKTIRFYDNKGVLPANYVSKENGYRFYEEDTVELFRQISKLKEAGFTLAEIDQHLKAQDGISTENFIDKKIEELKSQIAHCYKLKEQDNMREINIAFQKLEAERTRVEQTAIINLRYGNQKTLLPVAAEIVDECEKLIQRIATPGICAINCEEDEFIRFVQGRKAVEFVSMHFDSNTSREEITKKVNQTKYEKYDAVFVYCSCSSATSKNTLVILDFAKWFDYETDDKRQKRAEGAFEFNEDLDGVDVKLILFEKNTDI